MLHSALLKTTIKKPPNPKYSSPVVQKSPQASARKAHISWALWTCIFFSALACLYRGVKDSFRSVTGQDRYQRLSPTSPPSASLSHTPPPEQQSDCAGDQLSPPACTASPEPLPQLFLLNQSQQTESKQTQQPSVASAACSSALRHHHPIRALTPTPSPASSFRPGFLTL